MYNLSELKPINLTEGIDILMKNSEVIEFGHKISVALGCINTQRFKLIESEHKLLEAAKEDREKFLAGVVILNSSTEADTRSKRQASSLAEHIQYKIRMEVDSVPITSQIKERLWVPVPDGDFFYNMRYFWGFLQVQDFVDSAIIELHTGDKPTDEVLLQQFPYPCFLKNNYLIGLFTAQMIQVALIFGYSAIISTFVREYAWERESKNGRSQFFVCRFRGRKPPWLPRNCPHGGPWGPVKDINFYDRDYHIIGDSFIVLRHFLLLDCWHVRGAGGVAQVGLHGLGSLHGLHGPHGLHDCWLSSHNRAFATDATSIFSL